MLNIKKAASWNSMALTMISEFQGQNLSFPEEIFQIFQVMNCILRVGRGQGLLGYFWIIQESWKRPTKAHHLPPMALTLVNISNLFWFCQEWYSRALCYYLGGFKGSKKILTLECWCCPEPLIFHTSIWYQSPWGPNLHMSVLSWFWSVASISICSLPKGLCVRFSFTV